VRLEGDAIVKTNLLQLVLHDDSGQGLVEYALIISLIALVAFSALIFLGQRNNNSLRNSANTLPG